MFSSKILAVGTLGILLAVGLTRVTYRMIFGAPTNVLDFGADITGTNDSSAAFTAAHAKLGTSGGTIYVPCGTFLLNSSVAITKTGVVIRGAGYCSQLLVNHASDAFAVSGALFVLENVEVQIATGSSRAGAAVIHATANQGIVRNMRITSNGGSTNNGYGFLLDTDNSDLWHFAHVRFSGGPGTWQSAWRLTLAVGTVASTFIHDCHFVNGLVSNAVIDVDGAIDTLLVTNSDFPTFGGKSIRIQNTVGAAAGLPRYLHFTNVSTEGGNGGGAPTTAVDVVSGFDFQYEAGYIASATTGIAIGAGVQYAKILGNHFVSFQQSAITVDAASQNVTVEANTFLDAGQQTTNTYDTISVAAGAQFFKAVSNVFNISAVTKPRYHINLLAGGTDNYVLLGNTQAAASAGTAFINNGATGSNRNIWGNIGFTNVVAGDQSTFNTQVNLNAALVAHNGVQNDSGNLALTSSTGITTTQRLAPAAVLQANLGAPGNGQILYCSDCTIANPCAGGGTGAFAKRLNGIWVCN